MISCHRDAAFHRDAAPTELMKSGPALSATKMPLLRSFEIPSPNFYQIPRATKIPLLWSLTPQHTVIEIYYFGYNTLTAKQATQKRAPRQETVLMRTN